MLSEFFFQTVNFTLYFYKPKQLTLINVNTENALYRSYICTMKSGLNIYNIWKIQFYQNIILLNSKKQIFIFICSANIQRINQDNF